MKLLIFNALLFFTLSSAAFAARPNWVEPENWLQISWNFGFVIEEKPRPTEKVEVEVETQIDGETSTKSKGYMMDYDYRPVTGYFLMYVNKDWRRVNIDNPATFFKVVE